MKTTITTLSYSHDVDASEALKQLRISVPLQLRRMSSRLDRLLCAALKVSNFPISLQ